MSCKMCLNAHVDPELTNDNDLSCFTIGKCTDSYRLMFRSGDGRPTGILFEEWNRDRGWHTLGFYWPNFCPNCGRRLTENEKKDRL